jgi:SNF2 family DNA or RNA helicase
MSLIPPWSPFFQSTARMKGRALRLAEKVQRVPPSNGELLRAEVRDGSSNHVVTLSADGRYAAAECSCDDFADGAFCRHIWAALLDAEQNTAGHPIDLPAISKLRPRAPKARKRDQAVRPSRAPEPAWIGRLTLLRQSAVDRQLFAAAPVLPVQRQIVYAVLPKLSARHNGLVIEVRQRNAIASGWSRPKALRISQDVINTMNDPADRELCALLLGAQWVREDEAETSSGMSRSHATFRVAPGAARRLLKQAINTGRAVVELDETGVGKTPPLRWDPGDPARRADFSRHEKTTDGPAPETPWKLYLVGTEAAEELIVTLEARRGEQRVPIERPALVLGGPDGLLIHEGRAAPFDDHDAYRWVSQFRDERYDDEGGRAMRIAADDIPRFLERLYLLPQLPELDLPERHSRTEQRVDPAPHLELFSPGSREQRELAPGAAKGHLVARVWFDYAGTRINPTQAGRFVPVKPNHSEDEGEGQVDLNPPAASVEGSDDDELETLPAEGKLLRRDRRAEREAIGMLGTLGFRQASSDEGNALLLPQRMMSGAVGALINRGWSILADRLALRGAGPPALSVSSGIDWFELRGEVTYTRADGQTQSFTLPEILKAARDGQAMIRLDDGSHGLLPEDWLKEHGLLTAMGEVKGDHLRFRSSQAALLDALLDERELSSMDEPFAQARQAVRQFESVEPMDPQPQFKGTLRPYQREGLGWLSFLRTFGMGGILADDMGLGKTIQVLAMVQARRRAASRADASRHDQTEDASSEIPNAAPSLIVAPRSVVFNWIDEAHKFTPELKIIAYSGPDRAQLLEGFDDADLIVTSYGLLRRDVEELLQRRFDYVVLDEAQAIKNPSSQSAKACRLMQANHRLALTGTPIENHLGDLWSIFEFLNPGMLGANSRFNELIRHASSDTNGRADFSPHAQNAESTDAAEQAPPDPDQETDEQDPRSALEQVATALRPFILRRTKRQVLKDLPEKTEQTIHCEMEPAQRKVYDQLKTYYRGTLLKQLDTQGNGATSATSGGGLGRNAFMVLEALLRLRQAACHPALIDRSHLAGLDLPGAGSGVDLPSAKLDALDEQLDEIIEEGSKALVFSQFTSMLSLVKQRLDARNIPYAYLDGQTRDRREQVAKFQTDDKLPVFLISLKAGGTGLNLTAAEYVFILDPWWNPAVEAQAIDRTHRIGQTKPVFAYRLICEDTVEQRILELQQKKRDLADAIVGGDQDLLRNLTRDDLERLLS